MPTITLSDAVVALKGAKADEIADEIDILQEEIADLQVQIKSRKKIIAGIYRFAGMKRGKSTTPARSSSTTKSTPTTQPKDDASSGKLWERIRDLLFHSGPVQASSIARDLGKSPAHIHGELKKRAGHVFEQIDDGRWRLVGQGSGDSGE